MGSGFDDFDKYHRNTDSALKSKLIKIMFYQDFKILSSISVTWDRFWHGLISSINVIKAWPHYSDGFFLFVLKAQIMRGGAIIVVKRDIPKTTV